MRMTVGAMRLWKLEEIGSLRLTKAASFRTDGETVAAKQSKREKTLVKWDEADDEAAIQLVSKAEHFDQFEVNSRLGVQAEYDEKCYTTELDLKAVDA